MKKIIMSLAMIGAVAALVVGATGAFFSDVETSTGNTFTAGTIDISVNGENPWNTSWENYLDKPSQVNYMNFVVKNEGVNPANVWKKLSNVVNGPGVLRYPETAPVASSEPEYEAGGGFTEDGYVERDNISAFMVYDMATCKIGAPLGINNAPCVCLTEDDDENGNGQPSAEGACWNVVVDQVDRIRVDNVADTWVKIASEMQSEESMVVSQSYRLMTWDDSGQPMVTNWAQGDTMTFDVELEARQLTAPAPGTFQENNVLRASVSLVQKNTTTWVPVEGGAEGTLTYDVAGAVFNYDFAASGLEAIDYQLVYYPDPWLSSKTVTLIGGVIDGSSGNVNVSDAIDLSMNLPAPGDLNEGVGAKVWLVPVSSLSGTTLSWTNTDKFLFDLGLVNYEDTDL